MSDLSKTEQLRQLLRPLADQFTMQVAATVMTFVQQNVRQEVEAVLNDAHHAEPVAPEPTVAMAVIETVMAAPAVMAAAPPKTVVRKQPRPKAVVKKRGEAGKKPGSEPCSKKGCSGSWYRPSGRYRKLCYKHFIAAGGKAPPGKKPRKK